MTVMPQEYPLSNAALIAERPRLIGLCAHLTGDAAVAEDLAQETLLEAWRHRQRLHDATGLSRWLSAFARNVCRRWQRTRGRDLAHLALDADRHSGDECPDPCDLQHDLERAEVAALLDRALGHLPPLTRAVLVGRYSLETPLPALAASLGLTEAATAKRIHRGARALRAVLEADRWPTVDDPETVPAAWQETRIWCIQCGRHRLLGRLPPDRSSITLRCPGCRNSDGTTDMYIHQPGLLRGVTTFKPAFSRVLATTHRRHQDGLAQPTLPCLSCRRPTTLRISPEKWPATESAARSGTLLTRRCSTCGTFEQTSLSVCLFALPRVQRFWRDHPRLCTLPERPLEAAGRPAVVVTFLSVGSGDRLDLLAASDTGRVLALNGVPCPD